MGKLFQFDYNLTTFNLTTFLYVQMQYFFYVFICHCTSFIACFRRGSGLALPGEHYEVQPSRVRRTTSEVEWPRPHIDLSGKSVAEL
jgi:hypothetical protein